MRSRLPEEAEPPTISKSDPTQMPVYQVAFSSDERDRVSIVVYGSQAYTVLQPTSASDPGRILAVLREVDADVIALQEVEARDGGSDMLAWLARETGYQAIAGTTLIAPSSKKRWNRKSGI